jgi:NAD(P)-dependent dehydrogenase (short-subunit alcohol dehydrogenase family)
MNLREAAAIVTGSSSGVGAAFVLAFIAPARQVPVYACCCARVGSFVMNRESDDKTLIIPRDARGVLWGGVEGDRQAPQKRNFAVRLLSGARERTSTSACWK